MDQALVITVIVTDFLDGPKHPRHRRISLCFLQLHAQASSTSLHCFLGYRTISLISANLGPGMAPFPPTCSAILPMNAKDYFLERDSAPFRALLAEVGAR